MKKNSHAGKAKGSVRRSAGKSAGLNEEDISAVVEQFLPKICKMIGDTKFDKRAFRIIPAFVPEEWQFFKITDKAEWPGCIRYELNRECRDHYEFRKKVIAILRSSDGRISPEIWSRTFRRLQKEYFKPKDRTDLMAFFPMPYLKIPEAIRKRAAEVLAASDRQDFVQIHPMIKESEYALRRAYDEETAGGPRRTFHCLEIDWRYVPNKSALEEAVVMKLRTALPSPTWWEVKRQGRAKVKRLADQLATLAAWRAKRVGYSHAEFKSACSRAEVKPGGDQIRPYGSAGAFTNAADIAMGRIIKFQSSNVWMRDRVPAHLRQV
jgi:hypothetical protein